MRVLVIDAIAPEGVAYLRERGIEVDEVSEHPREARAVRAARRLRGRRHALVDRGHRRVPGPREELRILGRAGVGVDNIDVDACSRQGVIVVNAPYGNVVSAAEHTVGMLLALRAQDPGGQ